MSQLNSGLPNQPDKATWLPTKTVVNTTSAGGSSVTIPNGFGRLLVSGALTAGALSNILSLTGRFELPILALYANDATARTLRMQVIVDGVIVYDATSSSLTAQFAGIAAAGPSGPANAFFGAPIRSNSSLIVNIASSLTETGKATIAYMANGY